MRQVLYISDSLVGRDEAAIDRIMVQSQHNNAIDGVTGLLWSDGKQFAQVLEGDDEAVGAAMERIVADTRHTNVRVVHDVPVHARDFGDWAMERPAVEVGALIYEERMLARLSRATDRLQATFSQIVARSRTAAW